METVIETGAAALFAGYLVAFYKHGAPTAPSWSLVLVALLAGIGGALLAQISTSGLASLTDQAIATLVIQGVVAAAGAAGLTRTDLSAEVKRQQAAGEIVGR
jgi:hypothetical protein